MLELMVLIQVRRAVQNFRIVLCEPYGYALQLLFLNPVLFVQHNMINS